MTDLGSPAGGNELVGRVTDRRSREVSCAGDFVGLGAVCVGRSEAGHIERAGPPIDDRRARDSDAVDVPARQVVARHGHPEHDGPHRRFPIRRVERVDAILLGHDIDNRADAAQHGEAWNYEGLRVDRALDPSGPDLIEGACRGWGQHALGAVSPRPRDVAVERQDAALLARACGLGLRKPAESDASRTIVAITADPIKSLRGPTLTHTRTPS